MELIIVTFFNAVATVDVRAASNNDVNFVETQTLQLTVRSPFRFERINKVDRDFSHSAISKFYLLFAP